ncbi:restriction endonuclease subunit S [Salmonella enterica]|nr:restriction endonuclease subunit S [Salmonella enterica subsp. enterica serovar Mbandaka]EDJ2234150.1 restriction endonuclease subunit S [Salmonella enterica subsp. enterica serovar Mbandaka]EGN7975189.1 restriction endonuclease subunit S [Salmonella enterica]EGO0323055.1 restriction endonuclease subunit S [Salmonella enterica]MIK51055.1 restriction endonuclease subunit S [Salmonella enterica]
MSVLSYLEKLLNGVDIQWKTIGEVTLRTSNIKWREATRSYRYVDLTSVDIETKKITETTEVTANNAPSRAQKLIEENDVIFATTRPTQQRFCLIEGEYSDEVASTGFCVLRAKQDEVLPKWIWHWISTSYFKKYVEENQSGSAYPAISDAKVKECYIPVPCPENPEKSLTIQAEIVRILDKFTALTAELTAELNMRKKQYNYYRDQLLSFEEGEVEWKTLGEISRKISSGGTPKTGVTEYYDGTIPWLRTQEVDFREIWDTEIKITEEGLKTSSAKWIPKDCIIIAMYGATVGKIGINKIPMTTNQACANIQLDEEIVHYRYVFHFLCSQYAYIKSLGTGSQTNINAQIVKNIKIPVPFAENPEKSLNEQLRIVNILDKFDTLTSSITEGLPREIELRQKQYEYYRDLLFSFPKHETTSN